MRTLLIAALLVTATVSFAPAASAVTASSGCVKWATGQSTGADNTCDGAWADTNHAIACAYAIATGGSC